ncbi:condensation domain-containing protein, partial [Aquimarina algiphila]|uniref:condensation domain-containing protein n=1 Tax=Aquimarina algiphila TaxID=2047982 RepID=UPI0023313B18
EVRQYVLDLDDLGFVIGYEDYRLEDNKEDKVKSYIGSDSVKVFDLSAGPLIRASLLQLSDDHYIFYYNIHHIIGDGWSMNILSRDVFSYYDAYKLDTEPDLPLLRIQYKDYASWQLGQLESDLYDSHRRYWLEELSGDLPVLDLPSLKIRPLVKTHRGRRLRSYLGKDVTGSLRSFSQDKGGTLF